MRLNEAKFEKMLFFLHFPFSSDHHGLHGVEKGFEGKGAIIRSKHVDFDRHSPPLPNEQKKEQKICISENKKWFEEVDASKS